MFCAANVRSACYLKKIKRQIFSKDEKHYYGCSQMWFGGTICLKVGKFFFIHLYGAFMIEHSLGSIWHELFPLSKFHGFVLYLRSILQKVTWCLILIGMVMGLTFELLPWNRRKGKKIPQHLGFFLIGNIQYLVVTESVHGTLCARSKSGAQPPPLWIRVRAPQITKGPEIWGSSLVHMLLLSFAVCIADARSRL